MESSSLVGRTLGGRYRIDEMIGQGGMSAVYKAHDPNLKRVVAIKVIHSHLAQDPKFVARFEEEATAVASLRHPNIVQVFDYSHDGDLYYMVQEFVPGETLQEHLQRLNRTDREIAVQDVIRYAIDICEAAGYAHGRGMIHRDIKPANIMLNVHGRAILMDFGIVKITGSSQHTVDGAVVGTALYMPPELIRGEVPDARSDIYSLGVTLHEALSGQPPFEAPSAMTLLMMHLQDQPPDLCALRQGLPAPLCAIIRQSLAKSRHDRFESMAALSQALRDLSEQLAAGPMLHFQATDLDLPAEHGPVLDGTQLEVPPVDGPMPTVEEETPVHLSVTPTTKPRVRETPGRSPKVPVPPAPPLPLSEPAPLLESREQDFIPSARASGLGRFGGRRLWMSGLAVLVAVALGLAFFLSRTGDRAGATDGDGTPQSETPVAALTAGGADSTPVAALATGAPGSTPAAPAASPTMDHGSMDYPSPTTSPYAGLSAAITRVEVDVEQHYVADFETVGFDPTGTGPHVHFFFDNIPPAAAGWPEAGTFLRHTASSPFSGYTTADRPANAGQMCILIASPEHVPQPETAACAPLPDVVTATANEPLACRFGPGDDFPAVSEVGAGAAVLVQGLSNNELWWAVVDPDNRDQTCWLSTLTTSVSGDISTLPIVDGPEPGTEPVLKSIEIMSITLDAGGSYTVDFQVSGFEPAYPGTHIHFFFNTFSPADVGIGGDANRRSYGGTPPFTGFTPEERPVNATELCAVVANPDHSVVPESGNCFLLPDLPSAEITSIEVGAADEYVVDFGFEGFEPVYPGGTHLHFFFNTFSEQDVGIGGQANRRSWGEGAPFTGFARADRPADAARLCVVVANPDHSVIPRSGNCFALPDLPSVELTGITLDDVGTYRVDFVPHEFVPAYPGGTHLHFYWNTFSDADVGIGGEANRRSYGEASPFAGYTAAERPQAATQMCAIVAFPNHSVVPNSGACIHLPDVLQVEITGITLDSDGRYVVDYVTYGFTPQWPGNHVHFYFNTVTVEELRQEGSTQFSHGGASPYSGYSTADKPTDATELCAIVATADNEHLPNSGGCFPLPEVKVPQG